jgi:N-methylhydantoinase A
MSALAADEARPARFRLGVDIGGTFTDFALVDGGGRRVAVHKQLTTPADPSLAVLEGMRDILAQAGIGVADLQEIAHGTTLVTNALIERRGARTGMLVTEGFRDLLDIGREQRYDLFDMRLRFAAPIVPRQHRAEVPERLRHDGTVLTQLDEARVRHAATHLVERHGITSLAICYLHAHANAAHEARTRAIVQESYPALYISTSADVFPYMRELDRWTTTCANAYAQPLVDRYLSRLEQGLHDLGFAGRFWIIGSSGGLLLPETARRYPVRLLESGPAAGVLMSARFGRERGEAHVLSFDLGGTTAKGALIRRGKPLRRYTFEAAHAYEHRSGSGIQLQIPVIDMTEIGTGGGSLVALDELGRLRVGPRSAGAEPGPACYGKGGIGATLTDANLVLGYLDGASFLGGRMALNPNAAATAIQASIGNALGLEIARAAWGIHDIANEDIARSFRMHATERGFDHRGCAMVAFGGGGPLHAARIARKLGVKRVIYPAGAGVMSAFGMLSSAQSFETVRARLQPLASLGVEDVVAVLGTLAREASAPLLAAGVPAGSIRVERRVDMRYRGQGHDLEVRLPDDAPAEDVPGLLPGLFAARYRELFRTTLDGPVEIVGWKVEASAPAPETFRTAPDAVAGGAPEAAVARRAYFPSLGGYVDCPVHQRQRLAPGTTVVGPALIEEPESTCLLDAGDAGRIDAEGNLVAEIGVAEIGSRA